MTVEALARLMYDKYREAYNLLCEWSPLKPMPEWRDIDSDSKSVWLQDAQTWARERMT